MGYAFKSKPLRGFNKLSMDAQLEAVRKSYWNPHLPDLLKQTNEQTGATFAQPFFDDLNGLLDAAENGQCNADEFKAIAATCGAMTAAQSVDLLKALYAGWPDPTGILLMRCMRIINRQNHSISALNAFKTLFDSLGVKIVGPWDKCVSVASFGSTSYHDGILEVALP